MCCRYSKEEDGICCVLVCRVAGGHVLYNDEVTPDAEELQRSCLAGEHHSIIGDREKCRNTFKEYPDMHGCFLSASRSGKSRDVNALVIIHHISSEGPAAIVHVIMMFSSRSCFGRIFSHLCSMAS
eukprot:TRINITY_DN7152_c0_g1_i3.p2 TRINITY_DN7152_c0_g1~~TRINITY_DN7152_c0_g1_i3.p2  ORF type:complete len:126 (-),score=10.70 TRINITY_DN7152_c0_g1_i3:208-585(-)